MKGWLDNDALRRFLTCSWWSIQFSAEDAECIYHACASALRGYKSTGDRFEDGTAGAVRELVNVIRHSGYIGFDIC